MKEVELYRHSHLIDPVPHFWGWEVPVYLFLGGLAAGVMILAATLLIKGKGEPLSRWARYLPFAAPIAISLGMLALFLDLEHKQYVWRFYLAFKPLSPMSWGAWILLGIYPATILLGLAAMTKAEITAIGQWGPVPAKGVWLERLAGWAKENWSVVAWANVMLGIALGAYTGILIGTLAARAAWSSVMLVPLFLVSGLSTGAALMMLFPLADKEHHALRRWDLIAIGVEVALLALFFLGLAVTGGTEGAAAAALFFGGPFTAPFWALVVIAGLAAPFVLELIEIRRNVRPTLVAPALVLVGGLSLRFVVVMAGQV